MKGGQRKPYSSRLDGSVVLKSLHHFSSITHSPTDHFDGNSGQLVDSQYRDVERTLCFRLPTTYLIDTK